MLQGMKILFVLSALVFAGLNPAIARQASEAPGIAGKWHMALDTDGGPRTAEAVFEQQGAKVTGKWDGNDVQGTFENGALNLSFTINSAEAGSGTLSIKGKLVEDKLTGSWGFQSYSGTFQGTRAR